MPNHITNILTIEADGDVLKNILEAVKCDKTGIGSLDFNKIIPMPESLNMESGSRSNRGLELYRSFLEESAAISYTDVQNMEPSPEHSEAVNALLEKYKELAKDDPDLLSIGKQCYVNIQKYGTPTWYEWACANWDTKWNSYGYDDFPEYEDGSNKICFQTAWSAPHPVIQKLSEMYPEINISHRWADEDFSCNTGEREYLDGVITCENIPAGGSKEAYEMAAKILGICLDEEDSEYCLSADESTYLYLDNESYELIDLFEKPALLSVDRITTSEIPKGLFCYDLRSDDNGNSYAAIEPKATVNHEGSVITDFPIDFGQDGCILFDENNTPIFLGTHITIGQYMHGEYDINEICGQDQQM